MEAGSELIAQAPRRIQLRPVTYGALPEVLISLSACYRHTRY